MNISEKCILIVDNYKNLIKLYYGFKFQQTTKQLVQNMGII